MIEDALDIGLINQKLYEHNLDMQGTGPERATALEAWYEQQDEITIGICDTCQMGSDIDLSACPFCGDDSEIIDALPIPDSPPVDIVEAAPAVPVVEQSYSAIDLDEICDVIGKNQRVAAESIYRVGQLLVLVHDKELWKLRVDVAGELIYRGFYEWAEKETGFKHAYVHRVMNVVRHFSEKDVQQFGITGLSMGLRVPDDRKPEFLARAAKSGGMNNIEMRSLANELTVPVEQEKPAEQPVVDYSTVYTEIRLGSTLVNCKKRTGRHAPVNSHTGPARSITDMPWFDLRISPDLWLAVRFFKNVETGNIQAVAELRGVEDERFNKLLKQVKNG